MGASLKMCVTTTGPATRFWQGASRETCRYRVAGLVYVDGAFRMDSNALDFLLPRELIAQSPPAERSAARLLHYQRADRSIQHRTFADLPRLLRRSDVLVFNNARVLPARFLLRKESGGAVEGLFLTEPQPGVWSVLLKNLGNLPRDSVLRFEGDATLTATLRQRGQGGEHLLAVNSAEPALAVLARVGRMPLPPYIKRHKLSDPRDAADRERYQTVYAAAPGSVAAPTAGLHFTPQLLQEIDAAGAQRIALTLHVGIGTFKPVTAARLEDHAMHAESYSIDAAAADALNRAHQDRQRIIAVGTTAARVLESWPANQPWRPASGQTSIFIYPPYTWKRVGAMITNFHLPRSTLIALVAALVGLDEQRQIYAQAIAQRYRFFSYGDAMFVE
jgi:S-adenosylmethionine:tRNA ribosyltransferase-isomerase